MNERNSIQVGNAEADGQCGWLVGSFIDEKLGLRHSKDVELKWSTHVAGEERPEWVTGETRTTIGILVSGRWEMIFRDQTVILSKPGDFVMWGPGEDHRWRALADAVMITVRWPSISSD